MESDQNYFIRRAREERSAAARATCPQAQQAHLQMAVNYEGRILPVATQPHQASA